MNKEGNIIWFHVESLLFSPKLSDFTPSYPSFFNSESYKWCDSVANNYEVIRNEFEQYNSRKTIQPYFYKEQAGNSEKWKTLPLITWNIKKRHSTQFPQTMLILQTIPGLVSASFSLLEAGGEITTHRGDTDASIRGHLCLYTAQQNEKAAFTVNNITKSWEEGKWLLFCDAHKHGGFNHSIENRLVLIVDVLHTENIPVKNKICSKVLAGLVMNYILVSFRFFDIRKLPKRVLYCIYISFEFSFRLIILSGIKI